MKSGIVFVILLIAGIVLVVGLWLLGYHLTGKWAFNHWRAERIASGDRLDWNALVPPKVADDQNFALDPMIRGSIVENGQVDARFKTLEIPQNVGKAFGNWQEGRRDDLEAARSAYGKVDLQAVFKPMEPSFLALDQASKKPGCRFPTAYEELEMPALLGFRAVVRNLRLRALMNLRSGHPDLALEDLQTCFRLADQLKAEPSFITAILRIAILNISMQVVWEGVEDHLWGGPQLTKLQAEMAKIDLLASSKLAWQSERQNMISSFTVTAENRPPLRFMAPDVDRHYKLGALGRGWFYRNLLVFCEYVSSMVDAQDPFTHRVFPGKYIEPEAWMKRLRFRIDLVMARIAIPALSGQVARFAKAQALIDEATVVCAMERFRMEKGRLPDHLAELTPGFLTDLPHDLVTGGPLHFSRKGDTFTLYQVGWDGKDDGGALAWTGEGEKRTIDPAKGDWAWPHADH